ncbi:hypothetical protein [Roseomonas sp. USHLN139]
MFQLEHAAKLHPGWHWVEQHRSAIAAIRQLQAEIAFLKSLM